MACAFPPISLSSDSDSGESIGDNDERELFRNPFYKSSDEETESDNEESKINTPIHKCTYCEKTFKQKESCKRHVNSIHKKETYNCQICGKTFSRKDNCKLHEKMHEMKTMKESGYVLEPEKEKESKKVLEPEKEKQSDKVSPSSHENPPQSDRKRKRVAFLPPRKRVNRTHHPHKFKCDICARVFARKYHLMAHQRKAIPCRPNAHASDQGPSTTPSKPPPPNPECDEHKSVFNGIGVQKTWFTNETDIIEYLNQMESKVHQSIKHYYAKHGPQKWFLVLKAIFKKSDGSETRDHYLHGTMKTYLWDGDFKDAYKKTRLSIFNGIEEYNERGSGFVFDSLVNATLTIAKYKPIRGGCFIPLPTRIKKKNCCGTIRNTDNRCIAYAIAESRNHNPCVEGQPWEEEYYKKYVNEVKLDGIKMPAAIEDFDKIEKMNKVNINVLSVKSDKGMVNPIRVSQGEYDELINILMVIKEDKKSGDVKYHYTWIKDFDRLLQYDRQAKSFCYYCLIGFDNRCNGKQKRDEHMKICRKNGGQRVIFPKESHLGYCAFEKEIKAGAVIFGDFECLNVPIENVKNIDQTTTFETHHVASGYKIYTVSDHFGTNTIEYTGPDAVEHFITSINEEGFRLKKLMKENQKEMIFTKEDHENHEKSKSCYLCLQRFLSANKINEVEHLEHISPILEAINLPMNKIPTKEELKKIKKTFLIQNHPDKVGPQGKEATACFITSWNELLAYIVTHDLWKGDQTEDDEEEWEDGELDNIIGLGHKVRDHCHWTGKYRGAAHNGCNLRKRISKKIPVFFHNLSGDIYTYFILHLILLLSIIVFI